MTGINGGFCYSPCRPSPAYVSTSVALRVRPAASAQIEQTGRVIVTLVEREHDFAKPWAKRRVRIYAWCFAVATIIAVGVIIGVGVGLLPMAPGTGVVACFLFITPVFVAFVTSWIDVPGENRTTLEKANEFQMIWFVVAAAASELWWELAWLIGDVLGWMHLTEKQPWGFIFWYYGVADVRYLNSDGSLWAMEAAVVGGATILLVAWWKLKAAGNDPAKRIRPLWWTFFSMSMMVTVFFIYYVAEARHGFPDFPRRGFWDISIVLIYENLPWVIAPLISLPFVAKQLGYLYGKIALTSASTRPTGQTAQPTTVVAHDTAHG
ncbi:Emopamil-binding protein [Mycolicibacterium moriokaense]|uniref:Emopamil-binding protein n=1 Tax=Mycolicibacterium moriokaense TaxID=39691 RepID=UPI0015E889D9|nr:Emopamil-binding protein [Mycolicibacterium moriokaense]